MRKRNYILFLTLILTVILLSVLGLSSCVRITDNISTTEIVSDTAVSTVYDVSSEDLSTAYQNVSETTQAAVTEQVSSVYEPVAVTDSTTQTESTTVTTTVESTTAHVEEKTTKKTEVGTTVTQEESTVDLTVELPEANGKIYVDKSSDNKFTVAVTKDRKINSELLAAVYSLPASGQNYVLEFYEGAAHTKENLRRVYLLDDECNITSVAAAKSSEKENISATENWFCFNVLVKGVIFDSIEDELK